MNNLNTKLDWTVEQLWRGCVLAGLANAITISKYPMLAHEQSWDGYNYSVQDSAGQRGTISFVDGCADGCMNGNCVAAFRNENSERIADLGLAENYFQGAPSEIIELANAEALQYLLDEVDGEVRPFITTAFWGKDELYSNDTFEDMLVNGGELLEKQSMDIDDAIDAWQDYLEMNDEQIELLISLYERKVNNFSEPLTLSEEEIDIICIDDEGLEECRISFEEMGIFWA